MKRVHNFSAGPATLPTAVLEKARGELLDYRGSGRSIMEISHRSPNYAEVDRQAKERIRSLLSLGDDFDILFLQGGASSQFMMVPFNFLEEGKTADYIDTGRWSQKAIAEAEPFGRVHVPFSGGEEGYRRVPRQEELKFSDDPAYVHFTSNNTVAGTQLPYEPETGGVPLVADASSDFLSRPITPGRYGLIYAGAQKNAGPAGVTVVIVRRDFLQKARTEGVPTILRYGTHAEKLFNTPPTFNVYMLNLVLEWMVDQGGLSHFEALSREKSGLVYGEIDRDDFYRGAVDEDSRSRMNITFRIADESLESRFLQEAERNGLVALKGHRSVGGIRASLYNALPLTSVKALVSFMQEFRDRHG